MYKFCVDIYVPIQQNATDFHFITLIFDMENLCDSNFIMQITNIFDVSIFSNVDMLAKYNCNINGKSDASDSLLWKNI